VLHALRLVIGAVGALLLALGLVLLASGGAAGWSGIQLVIVGALGVGIALFEQLRYRGSPADPSRGRPTDERFIDPTTGQRMRVWMDPATGERTYLPDGKQPQNQK
jgi:hypothetical protein